MPLTAQRIKQSEEAPAAVHAEPSRAARAEPSSSHGHAGPDIDEKWVSFDKLVYNELVIPLLHAGDIPSLPRTETDQTPWWAKVERIITDWKVYKHFESGGRQEAQTFGF